MEKQYININENANEIMTAISKGVFLTTKVGDKVNSMAIEWGTVGRLWNKGVFICYVRESRFTREQLDQNPEFTINMPVGAYNKKIMAVCGSKSGRDIDKVKEAGLTLVDGEKVSVPAIKELPMTIECKVIYRQPQDMSLLPEDVKSRFYSPKYNLDKDEHITYIGEIVNSYILK